ncbi:MAG: site-2 protease family protein [Fimbriimonas sp.]
MPPTQIVAIVFVIFFGIGLHEYAHCKFADMAGDPTPGIYGRVTLNLTKHFELFGTLMMMFSMATGYGIGWGKPAPINEDRMRNPRWDLFAAVAAGPVSNLLQACLYGFLGRILIQTDQMTLGSIEGAMYGRTEDLIAAIIGFGVSINLSLAFFNLIPIAPLDGHWLVGQLLSGTARDKWYLYSRRYGPFVLMAIILGGQVIRVPVVYMVIRPAVEPLERILLGK